ncbi:NYN domain-containing protein [Candidatus Woesearchaeota archaeon]|nr:NYN domain-containing protein [Candidatus Woesearchaeota archaeon]
MKDTIVFIDAGFLSKLSKYFGRGKYLKNNIFNLSKIFSKKEGLYCKHIFYYTAPPFQSSKPTKDENKRKENYDNFIRTLSNNKIITVREGRCQKIIKNHKIEYHQKGVDTFLTMDLMTVPIKHKEIKKIILIACDSDFVPVIENLNSLGIKTTLFTYFDKKRGSNFSTSNELIQTVSKYILIIKQDFKDSMK